uniref:peptidylprolyl isomerase n=1 Tax=Pseudo-nitzschia delicatissima TaxID=44447 RepID=A0A7S0UGB2_9STRA|mmetsp:Transcript_3273/g.6791  ORF Transcript_3273/g.6791 Transcript_3273/m.6791 type:complete len:201 (+) Transcript_3273:85-687(+)|eukprot:CAMPEP_0197266574 /NCGR_PEP_ID=MMETSP1432-20130617/3086_1 /TAXON_ID=44447 /ORGANISM="Pseudo-nitzschia delicatissima, Strain UNC1205" /LENGTH=200 /DNA_ID=CAMNT_0042731461 /DNA_START=24 /DNA_END=626 /DNA_ORIENTATION=+
MPPKKKQKETALDKIVYAIRELKDPGTKGSSRKSIEKFIKSEFDYDNSNALKKAFKKGVTDNVLVQTGQSFRVAKDPILEKQEAEEDKLKIEDLTPFSNKGYDKNDDSPTAQPGDAVTVAYKGTLDDGYEFDKASKFTFVLGAGEVIKGWDLGIANMKVGGKRKLVVPSKLGYGKRGCAPDIPPNATLNFIVTLKGLKKR